MTLVKIGLENGLEGRFVAWALEHPGCYAFGSDGPSAVIAMGRAVPEYAEWIASHTRDSWFDPEQMDLRLVDTWNTYYIDKNYERDPGGLEINAFFLHDWKPLTSVEIDRGLQLLSWTREEMLHLLDGLSDAELDNRLEGERWSIRGIQAHLGTAEWWFLSRFGQAEVERGDLPKDPLARMESMRRRLREVLPTWAQQELVLGVSGELWSPRKVLRRAVWHERDHIGHIRRLLSEGRAGPGLAEMRRGEQGPG